MSIDQSGPATRLAPTHDEVFGAVLALSQGHVETLQSDLRRIATAAGVSDDRDETGLADAIIAVLAKGRPPEPDQSAVEQIARVLGDIGGVRFRDNSVQFWLNGAPAHLSTEDMAVVLAGLRDRPGAEA